MGKPTGFIEYLRELPADLRDVRQLRETPGLLFLAAPPLLLQLALAPDVDAEPGELRRLGRT